MPSSRSPVQLLTEGVSLSLAGGLLGILAAYWTGDLLLGFLPASPSMRGLSAQPDTRVLLFALALSIVTGVVFGLAPAWETFRTNVAATLKERSEEHTYELQSLRRLVCRLLLEKTKQATAPPAHPDAVDHDSLSTQSGCGG